MHACMHACLGGILIMYVCEILSVSIIIYVLDGRSTSFACIQYIHTESKGMDFDWFDCGHTQTEIKGNLKKRHGRRDGYISKRWERERVLFNGYELSGHLFSLFSLNAFDYSFWEIDRDR